MPSILKKLICSLGIFSLVACSGTQIAVPITKFEKRIELGQALPAPLVIPAVQFKVFQVNGKVYIAMDVDNFKKLANNTELMQDYLQQYRLTLEQYKAYYETQSKKN